MRWQRYRSKKAYNTRIFYRYYILYRLSLCDYLTNNIGMILFSCRSVLERFSFFMDAFPMKKNGKRIVHWYERPLKVPVQVCVCGNKYVKTRKNQKTCLPCLFKEAAAR